MFAKRYNLPLFNDGTTPRIDEPLYVVMPLDPDGEPAKPLTGKKSTINPGQVLISRNLRSPAEIVRLEKTGRIKKCGTWNGSVQGPTLDEWYLQDRDRIWDLTNADRAKLTPERRKELEPVTVLTGGPPDPGATVFRAVRKITSTRFGEVLPVDTLFTADRLSSVPSNAARLIETATEAGQIQHVGHIGPKGKYKPLPADQVPEIQGEAEPDRLNVNLREVYGTIGAGLALYRMNKPKLGFNEGDLLTPDAIPAESADERDNTIEKLISQKILQKIGEWTYRFGLVAAGAEA